MSKKSFRDLITRIVLFYFLLVTPFGIIGYMYYNYRVDRYLLVAQKDQQTNIQLQIGKLKELFRHVNANLLTGANHPMAFYLYSNKNEDKMEAEDRIQEFCVNMLHYNKIFSQASYLDSNGNQVLLITYETGKARSIPSSNFKLDNNKFDIEELNTLVKDGIYVSRLDLNVDSSSADASYRTVLHFITPVMDEDGKKYGYFVLNLLGTNMIDGLKLIGSEAGWKNYLLNNNGDFLYTGNSDKEHGFMFNRDSIKRFTVFHKDVLTEVLSHKSGVFKHSQGIYCYFNINARDLSNGMSNFVSHSDNWLMVSLLSNDAIKAGIDTLFTWADLVLLYFSGVLLMVIAGYFVISTHKQKEIQIQLTKSQTELILANKTKDKFISILAHDLKNPLSSIMGFVDLLKDGYEEMPVKSKKVFITSLENSTHLLQRLIDDVLAWARSTTGSMTVEKEPFLVNKVLEQAIAISSLQAGKKNVTLLKRYDEKIIGLADSRMIETIIRNLISNAIKFSFQDATVEIEMCRDNAMVYVSVVDHGVGMDEKRTKELFLLDHLTSTPGTSNEKGTGMGLFLCRDFIRKNKGDITVQSKPDVGSRFTINFPAYSNREV